MTAHVLGVSMFEPIASWPAVQGPVRAMTFVRFQDGGVLLVTADNRGQVHRFRYDGGKFDKASEARKLAVPSPVLDLTYAPRSSGWPELATISEDGVARVHDVASGVVRSARPSPAAEELRTIAAFMAPDGTSTLAVAGMTDTVYLWRGAAAEPVPLPAHVGPVRALAALRPETALAAADEHGIVVWDLSGAEPTVSRRYPGRARALTVLRVHGRSRLAAAAADSIGIRLSDPTTGRELTHFAPQVRVTKLAAVADADEDQLLAVANEQTVTLWSLAAEAPARFQLAGMPGGAITALARILTSRGTLLAAGDDQGNIVVWRLVPSLRATNLVGRHEDWVNDLAVVVSGRRLLLGSASDDRQVRLWEPGRARPYGDPLPHPTQVQALAPIPGGSGDLLTGDQHGKLRRWGIDGTLRWQRDHGFGTIQAIVCFATAEGTRLVSAGGSGHCLLADAETGEILHLLRPDELTDLATVAGDRVRSIVAVEVGDGWCVAAGDSLGRITVWDVATGSQRWSAERAHRTRVMSLAVVTVGGVPRLASGGAAGTIRLWDLANGRLIDATVDGHRGAVAAMCCLQDGDLQWLASGGEDRTIRLWDPRELANPKSEITDAHHNWVRALTLVAAAPVAQLASGGDEGAIRLWQVRGGQLIRSTHAPSIRGFRDLPTGLDIDLLDREALTAELHDLLQPDPEPAARLVTDGARGPQVVLIQGAWGTGKTTVMRALQHRLDPPKRPARPGWSPAAVLRWLQERWRERELSPYQASRLVRTSGGRRAARHEPVTTPVTRTVTAWFNPWAHQSSEQVWSGLAWSIVAATREQVGLRRAENQRYWLSRNIHRLDRGALRRTIRQRIWRPTWATLAALILPLVVSMIRLTPPATGRTLGELASVDPVADLQQAVLDPFALAVSAVVLLVLVGVGGYALGQYFFGRASVYLPTDIFEGPIDAPSLAATGQERLVKDLPYFSGAGQLYRINQDLQQLTQDLERQGCQLVVFIDDLDRCTPRSTADVFEAINTFLSDQSFPNSAPRFVIGLDSAVVVGRLTTAYKDAGTELPMPDIDDPAGGWAILRKLSQLVVPLPGIRATHTVRLLRQHSGDTAQSTGDREEPPRPAGGQRAAATWRIPRPRWPEERSQQAGQPVAVGSIAAAGGPSSAESMRDSATEPAIPQLIALESEPDLQTHLSQLIALRPQQSMRETKRLLTYWGFYMRLLARLLPPGATANVRDACDALTLAEVVRRWPALLPVLGRTDDGPSGLALLIRAVASERDDPHSWRAAVEQLGLDGEEQRASVANLYRLLRAHGNESVAGFADRLL